MKITEYIDIFSVWSVICYSISKIDCIAQPLTSGRNAKAQYLSHAPPCGTLLFISPYNRSLIKICVHSSQYFTQYLGLEWRGAADLGTTDRSSARHMSRWWGGEGGRGRMLMQEFCCQRHQTSDTAPALSTHRRSRYLASNSLWRRIHNTLKLGIFHEKKGGWR